MLGTKLRLVFMGGVASAILYQQTLAPSISWRNGGIDGAELAAAAIVGGVPHPPGYPAYMLIAQFWLYIMPEGDPAFWLNWLSLICTSLLIGCYVLTSIEIGKSMPQHTTYASIFIGACSLAVAPLVWQHATITEVYPVGMLLFALALYSLMTARITVVGLLAGLNAGAFPLAAIATVLLALVSKHRRNVSQLLGGLVLGALSFLYLPIRAMQQPPLNWGNPSDWAQFWWVVRGQQYHHLFGHATSLEWLDGAVAAASVLLIDNTHSIGWLVALAGFIALWKHAPRLSLGLFLTVVVCVLWFAGYSVRDRAAYLLPAVYALLLLLPIGLSYLRSYPQWLIRLAYLMCLIGLLWRGATLFPTIDLRDEQQPTRFATNTLNNVDAHAIIVSEKDETTFALWYQQTMGLRPDVMIIDGRLLFYDWYQQNLSARNPHLGPDVLRPGHLLRANRPIYTLDSESYALQQINP